VTIARPDMMGACGLDCGACDIRRARVDPEAAQRVVTWFRQRGWLSADQGIAEAIDRGMTCTGCLGDRELHWAPDCAILRCCVDETHLEHCAQCEQFLCDILTGFAADGHAHHREAVERLKKIVRAQE